MLEKIRTFPHKIELDLGVLPDGKPRKVAAHASMSEDGELSDGATMLVTVSYEDGQELTVFMFNKTEDGRLSFGLNKDLFDLLVCVGVDLDIPDDETNPTTMRII